MLFFGGVVWFFSAKAMVWVTRAILRWILQVSSRKAISVRQCYSTIWWGPSQPPAGKGLLFC